MKLIALVSLLACQSSPGCVEDGIRYQADRYLHGRDPSVSGTRRLDPAGLPSAVADLSEYASGLYLEFTTHGPVDLEAKLGTARWPHLPPMASGWDVYHEGDWNSVTPLARVSLAEPGSYRIYLPLFRKVRHLEVRSPVPIDWAIPRKPRVAYYGTSIVQGMASPRPGLSLPALVGRRLGEPVAALGFSGNGRMDMELVPILRTYEVVIVDCLPNMTPAEVESRAPPFLGALDTAVVLVGDCYDQGSDAHRALKAATGSRLVTYTWMSEEMADRSHPNAAGLRGLANIVAIAVRQILPGKDS